jgi:threonine synthase
MNNPILYYSTNLQAPPVTFKEALLKGLAPDKGLYMPETIPGMTPEELQQLADGEYYEVAYAVSQKLFAGQIPNEELLTIVKEAYNFPVPLENVYHRTYVMRLDQGPTASFKDFAARMMGRVMQYFLTQDNRNLVILTATSGDTGSAIANAFYGLENIQVIILYPENEVTDRQRKQMTTLEKNIRTIALQGKFDDCQAMVKRAFADAELDDLNLSSANSINIGRLLPQTMYYIYAFVRLSNQHNGDQVIFSVPSGNFGDLMGGLIAKKMGLPVKKFVVVTNENNEFPKFVASGEYQKIVPSRNCISSAMNVGHPSNIARLIALYGGQMDETGRIAKAPDLALIRNEMYAVEISDEETKATIQEAYENYQLMLEPHGAVGWAGLARYLAEYPADDTPDQLCIALETAHPAKFPREIRDILSLNPALPPSLEGLEEKKEVFVRMSNDYEEFKRYLKKNY